MLSIGDNIIPSTHNAGSDNPPVYILLVFHLKVLIKRFRRNWYASSDDARLLTRSSNEAILLNFIALTLLSSKRMSFLNMKSLLLQYL